MATSSSLKVKVLEVLGPSKFSVRANLTESDFHSLQCRMDLHYLQAEVAPSEEKIPLSQGDSVRSVVFIPP